MTKLTDTQCRTAKRSDKDRKLFDGDGLYLLVTKSGGKLRKLKYRFNGIEKKLSIGSYPEVSLKEARATALEQRALLAKKVDPSAEKRIRRLQAEIATATTFKSVGEEYIAKLEKEGRAPATLVKARWMLGLLSVSLGTRPVSEIKPLEVLRVLNDLEVKDQLETARKVRALASRIFRYAIATARPEHDPCPALRGAIAAPQVKSHAALLDPAAIGGLMRAIRTYTGEPTIRLAMELSAHVFQRPGEIRQALWSEIDLAAAIWTIPAARMKMRQPHRVPLSKRAVEILTEAHELTGAGDFVFPSLRTTKRPMSENTVNAALRRYGAKRGFELQAYRSRLLGSRLVHNQKATAAARLTADRKFLASLS